jgi:hypothetical protein
MKKNPLPAFFIALTVAEVFIAGYWVRQNPLPNQNASISPLAPLVGHPETVFQGERKLANSERRLTESGLSSPRFLSGQESPLSAVSSTNDPARSAAGGQASREIEPTAGESIREDAQPSAQFPLAFRDLPPEVTASRPQMAAALKALQQDFLDAVGGPNQDPADPAYYGRWVAARKSLDEQYRLLVGNQTFLGTQAQVNNQ